MQYYRIAAEYECKGNLGLSCEYYERALSIRHWYQQPEAKDKPATDSTITEEFLNIL